jgi:hypothetical protein
METGSGIWLSLSRKTPPTTSLILRWALGRWRLEVASSIPYLAKLHFMNYRGPWSMETGSGIWLSLYRKAPPSTNFMVLSSMRPDGGGLRSLGRRRLEVASGFPYLAKLLSPPASCTHFHAPTIMHPPSCNPTFMRPSFMRPCHHAAPWWMGTGSGIWLSLSSKSSSI